MKTYAVKLVRHFPAAELINPSAEELESGEEDSLAGNMHYRDLRGFTWDDVAKTIERETALFERFAAVDDWDEENERFDEERIHAHDELDALWGLDIGTAAATLALSAIGAIPVASCNAGGFGGHHAAEFPYVAFYIGTAEPGTIFSIAEIAEVGLDVIHSGLGLLFGRTNFDLHMFAVRALVGNRPLQA
jgi:hypothetical protein